MKVGDRVNDVHVGGVINFSGSGGVGGLGDPNGELLPPPLPVVLDNELDNVPLCDARFPRGLPFKKLPTFRF